MGKYNACISFSISANVKPSLFLAAIYLIGSPLIWLYFTREMTPALRENPSYIIVTWFLCAVLCIIGALYLAEVLLRVCLAEKEIAVTLFGIPLRRYPVEKLGMLCASRWDIGRRGGHYWKEYLGICSFTPEEAAAVRERQQSRNPFTKRDLPLRKRNPSWQNRFVKEYMNRRARWEHLLPLRSDVLWCQWDSLRLYLLKDAYGQIPWLDLTEDGYFDQNK